MNEERNQEKTSLEFITKVNVTKVKKKVFEYYIHTQGKIRASQQANLQFGVQGVLLTVCKKNGDFVKKGELLAELDRKRVNIELKKAKIVLAEKEIAYNDLVVQYYGEPLDKFKMDKEVRQNLQIKSGLIQANIALEEAHFNVENSSIIAPFSGIIADIKHRKRDLISSNESFCVLYNRSPLQIECEILEDDFVEIELGQMAEVSVLSYEEIIFEAIITEINPKVNENGLINVKLTLSKNQELLPGMNVSVTIKVPREENIIVPKEAVVIRSGRKVVFTIDEGMAKWNYVTTGLENGQEIEILEGLQVNKKVIITNNLQLAHDAPVKVIEIQNSNY